MTQPEHTHRRVVLGSSFQVAYLSDKEMALRRSQRESRRKTRETQFWLIVFVAIVGASTFGLHLKTLSDQRQEEFHQLQQSVAGPVQAFERARDGGLAARFASSYFASWQANVAAMQTHLKKLEKDPEDATLLSTFQGDVSRAASSCQMTDRELKQNLFNESKARCPAHPGIPRDSGNSVCPYAPEHHHAFEVWTKGKSYCWRNGSRKVTCKRLAEIHLCN